MAAALDPHLADDQRQLVNGRFLGPVRWHVFLLLWERMGRWVTTSAIAQTSPGLFEHRTDGRSIKVHICNIRKALAGTPYAIETQYGMGYRMVKR